MVSTQTQKEMKEQLGLVQEWVKEVPPGLEEAFWRMQRDFEMGETKIPNKYKQLIGLGVAAATRCRYCTLFHTEAAKLEGATPEEIAEANGMAAFTMGISTYLNGQQIDYEKFEKEVHQIIDHVRSQQEEERPVSR